MGRRSRNTQGDRSRVTGGGSDRKPPTRLVTGGRRKEWTGAVINPPVWRASTHTYGSVADLRAGKSGNEDGRFFYGRRGAPTQWALAEALTDLEPGAHGTMLFPSGVAAISCALLAVLRPGDVLLVTDNAYDPSRSFAETLLKRWGVETHYFDPMVGEGIAELICDKTRAILMESPGSLTFEVQDVPAICAAARERGVTTLLDNTWAASWFFQGIEKGADVTILAGTKYIGGHSDLMLGSVTTRKAQWMPMRRTAQQLGQVISPDDAFLALRGLRTLGVRLRQHEESGLRIANWLVEQPQVARVLHPALPGCPGHEIWKRDFSGSAGLFSVVLDDRGGDDAVAAMLDGLELFAMGYSWGGYESLAIPVDPGPDRTATGWQARGPVIRLSIGLEDADDLIADLAKGLERFEKAACKT
ncbi:cystathionine beta-lyase [Parasphingopyxis marina]|uniref:Cystathionine beta-lyase n=1 Tax=Parasphingopyxis marina TaxID=2761622 RepID=A0A842I0Z1_9SPHN|nr:cystathionine beta-lyase [Parasphingopyxis marina]MBC2778527.1 cystathionine beta-lyase [Parasphingopyxis marina]